MMRYRVNPYGQAASVFYRGGAAPWQATTALASNDVGSGSGASGITAA